MKRRSKEKVQENASSRLLTPQENERILDLLGRRCVVSTVRQPIVGRGGLRGSGSFVSVLLRSTVKNCCFLRLIQCGRRLKDKFTSNGKQLF